MENPHNKKVLISADMEGATGVTSPDDVRPGSAEWQRCRRLLTGDINAAAAGFFDGGATAVLINEAHSSMRNVILEEIDPRTSVIVGSNKPLGMMEGLDSDITAVAFIGYHAAAGTGGVLSHTYLGTGLVSVTINGESASEGRMNAMLANELGAPIVLVTGDDLTCADAATYAPDAITVVVKTAIGRYAAACLPPSVTADAIRDAARIGLENGRSSSAPEVRTSYTYQVEFVGSNSADAATLIPGVDRISPRTVRFTSPTIREAIRLFAAVTTLGDSALTADYG